MSLVRRFTSRSMLIFGLVSFVVIGSIVLLSRPSLSTQAAPPVINGCQIFPADNIWNVPITNLPVDPNSAAYINSIGANTGLHPDFGSSGDLPGVMYGIPFVTVPSNQTGVPVKFDFYPGDSDPGPGGWLDPNHTTTNYPIPTNVPLNNLIEGGNNGGDQHVLVIQQGTCKLYETWNTRPNPNVSNWLAGSGAVFDLNSNVLRLDGLTSADAAGLPILPGLARYSEAAAGSINHALRFTVNRTRNTYVWPARHQASSYSNTAYPPMGQRFRLKASYVIPSNYSPQTKAILQALKTYGMIVADNGSNWYISGQPNAGWDDDNLVPQLSAVKGSNFEAVDSSSLIINANSGQAAVPPTSAPSNLAVAVGSTSQLNLSWTNTAPNTTGYKLERSLSPTSGFAEITTTLVGAPSYQNTGLLDGTTYYYRVRAYNAYGNGAYSSVVSNTTTFIPPTGLDATAVSASQINLSWTDNSSGESGYKIERATAAAGPYSVVGTTSSNATIYQDTGLLDGTKYYYQVRAFNSTAGTFSTYTTQSFDTTKLAPPTNLLAWATSTSQINLQWSDNSQSEDGYVVERSLDNTFAAPVIINTGPNVTNTMDSGLTINTQYFYRVKAKKVSVYSVYTSIVSATTTVLQVTVATDNGLGDTPNTLSYLLKPANTNISAGQTVLFTTSVMINSGVNWSPTIPAGVTLLGACGAGGPTISIDGSSALAGSNGLVLNQTTLIGIKVMHFPGVQIKNSGTGNKLVCTKAVK